MTSLRLVMLAVVSSVLVGCGPVPPGPDGGTEACVTAFPARITANYTAEKGCYLVLESPILSPGVTVTLKPGVKLVFSAGTKLQVSSEQVLEAVGTAAEPILLTGSVPMRGHWVGVRLEGNSAPSQLAYVTIEHAGDTTGDADSAGLKLVADSRGARVGLDHVTLQDNQGWGLWATGSAIFSDFSSCTLRRNGKGPANLDSNALGSLDPASTFRGNDVDRLFVRASGIREPTSWHALDVPYYVKGRVSLDDGFELVIVAGSQFIMAADSGFLVSGNASALVVSGVAVAPVLFTGETPTRGAWDGLRFDLSNNTRNTLAYAIIEYAGDTTGDAAAAAVKLTADSRGVQVKFDHVTVRQSEGWGVSFGASAVVPTFTSNTLTQNALGPAYVDSLSAHWLDSTTTFTGNDVDRIFVRAQWVGEVTWKALGVPYEINGNIAAQGMWTLDPGVVLEMKPRTAINIGGTGPGLHAVGTAARPIVITGTEKTRGSWDALHFDNNNSANVLDYCTVEYGGGGQRLGWAGMIHTSSDSRGVTLDISNSTVQHSAQYGIWFNSAHRGTVTGVTYADNALGDLFQQP